MGTENGHETATSSSSSSIHINIVSSTSGSVDEGNSISSGNGNGNSSSIKADGFPSTVQLPISAISAPSPVTTKAKQSSSVSNSNNSSNDSSNNSSNDSSSDNEASTSSNSSNNTSNNKSTSNNDNPTRTTPAGKNGKPLTVTVNGNDRSKDLNEHDVVCEKGRGDHERWPGNKLYRHLINVNKETYNDLAPIERSNIIGKIIGAIQEKDGWFVHHSEATGNWAKLTEEKVRKKVSDDLRREVRRRREKRSHNSLFSAKLRAIKEMEEAEVAARDVLERVDDPRQNDVLFGPGARRHPGNKIYWHHMKLNLEQYIISPYGARSVISRNIVGIIRSQHGRFLEQDPKTGIWYSISDKRALEKTSHALSNMKYKTRKRHPDEPPFPLQSPSQQQQHQQQHQHQHQHQQQQLELELEQQQQQQHHAAAAANMYNVNGGVNGGIGHHAHVPHGFVPAPPHPFHHMHPHHQQHQHQHQHSQQHHQQQHGQHPPHPTHAPHNYQHLAYQQQQQQQQQAVGPYGEDIVVYDDDITLDQEKILGGDSPNTVFAKTRTKKFRLINRMDDDVDVVPGTVPGTIVAPTPPPKGEKGQDSSNNISAITRTTTSTLSDVGPSGVVAVSIKAIDNSSNISATNPANTNATTIIDTMNSISNSSNNNNSNTNTNIIAKLEAGADATTTTPGGARKGGKIISPNSSQASVSETGSGIEYQEQRNPNVYRRQIVNVQHVPGANMPPVVGVGSPADMDYHHRGGGGPAATSADIAPRIAHFDYIKNYGATAPGSGVPPGGPGAAFKTLTYAVGMRSPDVSEYAPHHAAHHGSHAAVVPGAASVHMRRQYLEREVAAAHAAHAARGGHASHGHGAHGHGSHASHGSHGHHPPFAGGAAGQAEAAALNARRWAAAASAGGPPGYY